MSTLVLSSHVTDIEQGIPPHLPTTTSTSTATGGGDSGGASSDEESVQCSDEEEDTSSSECPSSCTRVVIMSIDEGVDLERGGVSGGGAAAGGGGGGVVAAVVEKKVSVKGVERDCRICHMSLDGTCPDSGLPMELGCCCKDDLGVAHKHCVEAWFKIRGNKICEICGSTARNVVGVHEVEQAEQFYEANDAITAIPQPSPGESRRFWQGHKFLNFLLACMVFAFVISWLFHFNVPS